MFDVLKKMKDDLVKGARGRRGSRQGSPLDQTCCWIEKAPGAQITFILVACYTQRNTYFDNGRIFHNKIEMNHGSAWLNTEHGQQTFF